MPPRRNSPVAVISSRIEVKVELNGRFEKEQLERSQRNLSPWVAFNHSYHARSEVVELGQSMVSLFQISSSRRSLGHWLTIVSQSRRILSRIGNALAPRAKEHLHKGSCAARSLSVSMKFPLAPLSAEAIPYVNLKRLTRLMDRQGMGSSTYARAKLVISISCHWTMLKPGGPMTKPCPQIFWKMVG